MKSTSSVTTNKQSFSWPIASVIFIITTLIFFSDILFGKSFFWDDITEYVYPMLSYGASMDFKGELPLWNPFLFNGMPFLADFQAQYFYPGHWFLKFFFNPETGLLTPKIIEYLIILHFVLAQFGMAFYAKSKNISMWGAILSAISFAFCGSMALKTNHPMIIYQLSLFPFILYHFEKGILSSHWLNTLYSGILLGIAVLAGHAQTSAYILIFLAVYGLWLLVHSFQSKQGNIQKSINHLIAMALPVIMATSIAAIQYIPGLELASYSERNEITYEKTTDGSMNPGQIFTAIIPNIYGHITGNPNVKSEQETFAMLGADDQPVQSHWYWDTGFYFGITALVLAILAIYSNISLPIVGTVLSLSIFAYLYALGNNGFLHHVFWGVPVFGQFRNPGRMMFYMSFGFSFLAGLGFDSLKKLIQDNKNNYLIPSLMSLPLIISLCSLLGIIPSSIAIQQTDGLLSYINSQSIIILLFSCLVLLIVFLYSKSIIKVHIAGALLCIIAFTDLYYNYHDFHGSKKNPKDLYIMQQDITQQLASKPPKNIFRVSMRSRELGMAMQRNGGMSSGIMLYEGYNPILLQRRNPPIASQKDMFDVLNIRYELALDSSQNSIYFKERTSSLGHARMVYDIEIYENETALQSALSSITTQLSHKALLEKKPLLSYSKKYPDSVQHTIKLDSYNATKQSFTVATDEPGLLCISEIWYPGWKAKIDGNDVELLRANWSLRAIEIPKGKHTVEMYFESESYEKGKMISVSSISLYAIIGFLLFFINKKKK